MSKKALIINPWVTDFKLYDEWMHPMGLYLLISLLAFNKWNIDYINCLNRKGKSQAKRFSTGAFPSEEIVKPLAYTSIPRKYKRYGIPKQDFQDQLAGLDPPDLILIGSGMTYWIDGLITTVNAANTVFPEIPKIIGGLSATLIPNILRQRIPDAKVFSGSMVANLSSLKKLHPCLASISIKGWDPSILPALQLIDHLPHGPILTSLGCPFSCDYCASSQLQEKFMIRSHDAIAREISYLIENLMVRDFAFYDDALLYQADKNIIPLGQKISTITKSVRFHVPNGMHARWINRDTLSIMQQLGFVTIRLGFETGHSKFAQTISTKTSNQEIRDKIALMKSYGFKANNIGIYVMSGLPNQKKQDVFDDISFIASLGVKVKPVFISPMPKTNIFPLYAQSIPQLKTNPLYHNDLFFITQLKNWGYSFIEEVKQKARQANNSL